MRRLLCGLTVTLVLAGCGAAPPQAQRPSPPKTSGGAASSHVSSSSTSSSSTTHTASSRFPTPNGENVNHDQFSYAYFLTPDIGWVAGMGPNASPASSFIFHTGDGGKTWKTFSGPLIRTMQFVSAKQGWALTSNGRLFKSTDAGATWTAVHLMSKSQLGWRWFGFFGLKDGYLSDGHMLELTTDGGIHWGAHPINGPSKVLEIKMISTKVGFAVGPVGIWTTSDGGKTWNRTYKLPAKTIKGVTNAIGTVNGASITHWGSKKIWVDLTLADCWAGGCSNVIMYSSNGGHHWTIQSAQSQGPIPGVKADWQHSGGPLWAICATGPTRIWGLGGQQVEQSTDAGKHWIGIGKSGVQLVGINRIPKTQDAVVTYSKKVSIFTAADTSGVVVYLK